MATRIQMVTELKPPGVLIPYGGFLKEKGGGIKIKAGSTIDGEMVIHFMATMLQAELPRG